jgi:SPP1 family predicted phage head-tail adaptor
MLAAKLRHRIDIQEFTTIQDSDGAVSETWADVVYDEPAEIVPLSGREFIAAATNQGSVTTRITIRYRSGLTEAMRIVHGTDYYNIKAILPDPSLRRHLTLMCEKGIADGRA